MKDIVEAPNLTIQVPFNHRLWVFDIYFHRVSSRCYLMQNKVCHKFVSIWTLIAYISRSLYSIISFVGHVDASCTCILMTTFGLCYKHIFPQLRGGIV